MDDDDDDDEILNMIDTIVEAHNAKKALVSLFISKPSKFFSR